MNNNNMNDTNNTNEVVYDNIQTYIDSLPDDILKLNLSNKELTELPDLSRFSELEKLYCCNNQLTSLPETLPESLKLLECWKNQLTYLPETLPNSLCILNCAINKLTSLPNHLPNSLRLLNCDYNQLTLLLYAGAPFNHLSNSLRILHCYNNQLTSLPDTLPDSLRILHCDNNQLTSLPDTLPDSLQELTCRNNQLISLPDHLPNSLRLFLYLNSIYFDDAMTNNFCNTIEFNDVYYGLLGHGSGHYRSPDYTLQLHTLHTQLTNSQLTDIWFSRRPENDSNGLLIKLYPILGSFKTISEKNKYIKERNILIAKEKAEERIKQLNKDGCLIEKAIQWRMKPAKIEWYLNNGYDLDDINRFL